MKLALVMDHLCTVGGAEQIFRYLCEEFPEADAFTAAYTPEATLPYFRGRKIRASWINRLIRSHADFQAAFPVATYVMEALDLTSYDFVLSCSASVAKYVRAPKRRHLCYCFMPTRALWTPEQYFESDNFKARVLNFLLPYLKRRDLRAAARVDYFIGISETSRSYIKQFYNREAEVIFSPIELSKFSVGKEKNTHYLLVSRLEHWKRVDYAIEAFNQLGLPLRIVGAGKEESRLRELARENITFLGAVSDEVIAREYREAKAVIFTPFLEYGLVPLEANASGTPVIAYGRGGIRETMIPHGEPESEGKNATAIFFYEQSADSLSEAVRRFENCRFDPVALAQHASAWGVPEFKRRMREAVNNLSRLAGSGSL